MLHQLKRKRAAPTQLAIMLETNGRALAKDGTRYTVSEQYSMTTSVRRGDVWAWFHKRNW